MTEALSVRVLPVIQVDGIVKGELARDLLRLEVEETTSGLKTLSARLVGHGPRQGVEQEVQLYLDGAILDFGKKLKVAMGPVDNQRTVFEGYISALESRFHEGEQPEVTVFAEDRLMRLRMTRHMKSFENMSDADIVQAIATEHGILAETDADGPTYDVVQQWNVSDLAFLRERARLIQAEIWFQDDKIYFMTRTKRTATELTLVRGNELIEIEVRADLAHQRTKVKFSGYDAQERDRIEEEAGSNTIDAEISGGRTGPSILEQAFGERVSFRVREIPLVDGEARAWARAEMLRRARSFVTAVGITRGTPDMIVGSKLTLQRIGHPFDGGGYYVIRVLHTYDLIYGYRTRFVAERPTVQGGS
ncbi:contractile injection system protein, VgrG/Pvc8 family [Methyloglobulus sp.]|uniref:phage late control D family protein n=1 Tax=Methyloglobulus sp. TaxID=2518622 RepID=UPI0032B7A71F